MGKISGVTWGVATIPPAQRPNLAVSEIVSGSTVAAVFTQNRCPAAPVIVGKKHLALTTPRYLMVNSGNANCATGEHGIQDTIACCTALAQLTDIPAHAVLPLSTGKIGIPLPRTELIAELPVALNNATTNSWDKAAQAIMTTDTHKKIVSMPIQHDDHVLTITGIAKGSGMIRPDMATMLAFIATDAIVPQSLTQSLLQDAVAPSFNAITVDGDTSTNDSCVFIATGQSGIQPPRTIIAEALNQVCNELAQQIMSDGEGITRVITIAVTGGKNHAECRTIAYAVAESPLVKAAFYSTTPEWGRILAAIGKVAPHRFDPTRLQIDIGTTTVFTNGARVDNPVAIESQWAARTPHLHIHLGRGTANATVWGGNLSPEYIRINTQPE